MRILQTHSSSTAVWLEEVYLLCCHLPSKLRSRGYPGKAMDAPGRAIRMLQPQTRVKAYDDAVFARYRGCVFSNRTAPEPKLRQGQH